MGAACLAALVALVVAPPAAAGPPAGFQETVALSGLTQPTAVRFAPDGRIFVAEKGGRIKVFDSFGDPTATEFADLRERVHDYWDRGLLGMALDPQFTTGRPYVYVLYAYNREAGNSVFPRWPDSCPNPPGGTTDGCVISGRLSRLTAGGGEEVLIEDWCQQYPSHSVGSIAFGPDGALYVSGGDGASFNFPDYGQHGIPRNPCGDPPAGRGGVQSLPSSQGGALRSQDIRTPSDPTGLGGTILRVDPDTGAAMPNNPNAGSPDANARRIVAYGLRNPFRITIRPGTNEVWAGDVGWSTWEEINRVPNPTATVRNFGWPCYEGTGQTSGYDVLDLSLCESLFAQGSGAHDEPYYTYNHAARVVANEPCTFGSSSISGLAFTPQASSFPPEYDGALFFSDYSRDCIWAMLRGSNGLPDPARLQTFVSDARNPAELQFGPGGDFYYVDLEGGAIRRVRSTTSNRAPIARATATPASGDVPLTVAFDGTGSSDPDGSPLTYAWDLDGDGAFDDSTASRPSFTYTASGTYTARLRVRDPGGLEDIYNVPITAGRPPVPVINITSPAPGTTWKVDDTIRFSGSATDFLNRPIPASGLTWNVNLKHCDRDVPTSCHTHPIQSFSGVSAGEFPAPDHEYPSYLEVELTARDSQGLEGRATRQLDPRTVDLTLDSRPAGLRLTSGSVARRGPFTLEVIAGSTNSIGAESPQDLGSEELTFSSWSNAGARNHTTIVNADTTLTATFEPSTARQMAGTDALGVNKSVVPPGKGEVYRTVAEEPGTVTEISLYVNADSEASALVLGLYADDDGNPSTLLGAGRVENPTPGAWSDVNVDIPGIEAGKAYWISLLNPSDSRGRLRWRDAGEGGGPEQQSASASLLQLPTTWETGLRYTGGPASAYISGTPPPPKLGVSPSSLSFEGRGAAAKPLTVTSADGSPLSFTVSDDAGWLAVTPAAGAAPRDVSVAVDASALPAGTHRASVRVQAPGEPTRTVPVTLRLDAGPSTDPPLESPPAGPVGAWGFDERRGSVARDVSGSGNSGRISGARRTRGRFGGGLAFDGRDDWVTVRDDRSLDLTSAMTLEAWVRPSALGRTWRSVIVKERPGSLAYALYAGTHTRPSGHVFTTRDRGLRGPSALPRRRWSHLAMTWDGLIVRAYVNGREVASHALIGPAKESGRPLRIGGNAIWPEWFKGVI
ncbi:MAG TPA: PQQ-dependent sugar dehydrogenase, partial [Solirubrobacteraceae bacterium]|nr:PQQ-dependent sugar dehydrogenase [Solirubrobacteraceae bacterium]